MLCGLYYYKETTLVSLPLQGVDVQCTIRDTTASVLLSQRYLNDSEGTNIEARYSFPIPVRAAVCKFAMIKQDGSRVVGVVEEKGEAKEIYDNAVQEGKLASLMEMSTPDVFTVSVGNILPQETVTVEVTYAVELTEDEENDSLRFHLPMHIGTRYGNAPANLSATQSRAFFKLAVSIEMAHVISKIGCPSHTIETELGPSIANIPQNLHANYARVSFTSPETLSKDFILTLKSPNADAPRCIAEEHPEYHTLALALTVVPKFNLPDVPKQEFIFVVDRSGSMQGTRIETAKKALVVLLRSLPTENTWFNIQSFGNSSSFLWDDGSRVYDEDTLNESTKHVDSMTANYGGTEIGSALAAAFKSCHNDLPTSLFVLTDGDTWNLASTLVTIKDVISSAPAHAPIRVFTLGIGNSASTAMVEGIARVGNGISTFVSDGESFAGKTARLLKAARTPALNNIRIDWGVVANDSPVIENKEEEDDFEMVSATETTESAPVTLSLTEEPVVLPPPAAIQQAPGVIKNISPGSRLRVYAILSSPAWKTGMAVPSKITLRASVASGQEFELDIPVAISQLADEASPAHVLAAKKLIQELEDSTSSGIVKASIVRLGKTYSLASSCTSFVAVDETLSLQRRCYNCHTTDSSSWRRSTLNLGEIVCNQCGLYERTHLQHQPFYLDGLAPVAPSLPASSASVESDSVTAHNGPPQNPILSSRVRNSSHHSYSGVNLLAMSADRSALPSQHRSVPASTQGQYEVLQNFAASASEYPRRRCYNCHATDSSSWRRSTRNPGEIVCNKCGLFERTYSRPRPDRWDGPTPVAPSHPASSASFEYDSVTAHNGPPQDPTLSSRAQDLSQHNYFGVNLLAMSADRSAYQFHSEVAASPQGQYEVLPNFFQSVLCSVDTIGAVSAGSLQPEAVQPRKRKQSSALSEAQAAGSSTGEPAYRYERRGRNVAFSTSSETATSVEAPLTLTLDSLARLQSFDGSFNPSPTALELFSSLISLQVVLDALPAEIRDEKLGLTLLAMASMVHRLTAEKEAWEGMYDKANRWCEASFRKSGWVGGVGELVEIVWGVVGK